MSDLELEQIVLFSRHGIRTPLPNTLDFLAHVTPKVWPTWQCAPGYLTTRGGTLESYFGEYILNYLTNLGCRLSASDIFIYANSLQRTVATAQYFSLGAFAGQDIAVNHRYPIERMDAIFNPVIRVSSATFKAQVIDDIKDYSGSTQLIEQLNHALLPAYALISELLEYKQSALYQRYRCEFSQLPTTIDLVKQEEPILQGPLAISAAIADAFTLQYYSGFAPNDIAWGRITSALQWQMLINTKNQYLNLLFQSPLLAKHIARPLIKFIDTLLTPAGHKFNLLVGHDSNIVALLAALGFNHPSLPLQYEQAPIGGKVAFYRFYDRHEQQHYFKAEYIYQTFEQLHLALPLTTSAPPIHLPLTLTAAMPNQSGLYLWQDVKQRWQQFLASA